MERSRQLSSEEPKSTDFSNMIMVGSCRRLGFRLPPMGLRRRLLCSAPPPAPPNPPTSLKDAFLAGVGATLGVASLSAIHFHVDTVSQTHPLLIGSLGASAALVYASPHVPFSAPKNVILGHVISGSIGAGAALLTAHSPVTESLAAHQLLPISIGAPVAVGMSVFAMQTTRTMHPPAGGTALIAVLSAHDSDSPLMTLESITALEALGFGVYPAGLGSVALVSTAMLWHRFVSGRKYP